MRQLLLLFLLGIGLVGCHPPQIDSCRTDLNVLIADLKAAPPETSRDDLIKIALESKIQWCVPFSPKNPSYSRAIEQGEHGLSTADYDILYRWIAAHD